MFKRILTFVAIAEEKSFTSAARRLRIAQPWLSVQLKQLEDSLGIALIHRSKTSFELTAEGERLLAAAKRVTHAYDDFVEIAKNARRDSEGIIVFGSERLTIRDPARNTIISSFIKNYPNIQLRVVNSSPHELFRDLTNGSVDVIFTSLPPPDLPVEVLEMCKYRLLLLMPEEHPLALKQVIDTRDLKNTKLITAEQSYHNSRILSSERFLDDIEWIVPPESDYESRAQMVRALGLPSFWIDYPENAAAVPKVSGLTSRELSPALHCQFGLMRLAGSSKKAAKQFWDFAAHTISSKTPRKDA